MKLGFFGKLGAFFAQVGKILKIILKPITYVLGGIRGAGKVLVDAFK